MSNYSSGQICELANITKRMLDSWTREGLIQPAVPAQGTGSERRWSEKNLMHVVILSQFRFVGVRKNILMTGVSGQSMFQVGLVTIQVDTVTLKRELEARKEQMTSRRRGRPRGGS